jgi:hypothetical protein
VARTVSREMSSCWVSLTSSSAKSSRVQRARPSGGFEQAVATSRASSLPESLRAAPGNAAVVSGFTEPFPGGIPSRGQRLVRMSPETVQIGGVIEGPILFAGEGSTLQIDGAVPANTIYDFLPGNVIDLTGVAYDPHYTSTLESNNELEFEENGVENDLFFNPSQNFAGQTFKLLPLENGGTQIVLYNQLAAVGQTVNVTSGPAVWCRW